MTRETLLEDSSFIEMEGLVSEGRGGKRSREEELQECGGSPNISVGLCQSHDF